MNSRKDSKTLLEPAPLQQVDRTWVLYKKRRFSYFAGCDYFRLSSHPDVLRAFQEGSDRYGLSVSASRMTTGNHVLYRQLERALARYFGVPEALVVATGYMTNMVVAQALRGCISAVVIDQKAHPSLHDAALLFGCRVFPFKTRDVNDLERVLKKAGKNPILLTDGLFSFDGQVAPLKAYSRLAEGLILMDDAHGAGVLGETGKGTPEFEGVKSPRLIQTITLSKALGAHGGAVLCNSELRKRILTNSPMFAGSTPMTLPVANAALAGVNLLDKDRSLRTRLHANVFRVKSECREHGLILPDTPAPILTLVPKSLGEVNALRKKLFQNQVFPSFIRYPGGPQNGYYRFVISSEHSDEQINHLLEAIL